MRVEVYRCDHPHKRDFAARFQISYTTHAGDVETVDVCRQHLGGSVVDIVVGQAIPTLTVETLQDKDATEPLMCEYRGCVRVFKNEHSRMMHYVKAHGYRRSNGG